MMIDLNIEEIKKIKGLIINRINDLNYELNNNGEYDNELINIIKDYDNILTNINNQIDK